MLHFLIALCTPFRDYFRHHSFIVATVFFFTSSFAASFFLFVAGSLTDAIGTPPSPLASFSLLLASSLADAIGTMAGTCRFSLFMSSLFFWLDLRNILTFLLRRGVSKNCFVVLTSFGQRNYKISNTLKTNMSTLVFIYTHKKGLAISVSRVGVQCRMSECRVSQCRVS